MGNLEFKDFFTYEIRTKNNSHRLINDYSEGYAASENIKGICGYIDKTGKETIFLDYKKVYDFHDGLARVKDKEGNYVFIDKNFNEIFSCKFYFVGNFYNGLALIRNENGLFGYIDKTGKEVIPCVYKNATDFIYKDIATSEVYAEVFSYKEGYMYIDRTGTAIKNISKSNLKKESKTNNLKPYKAANNLYGYKDLEDHISILPIHSKVNAFSEGFAVVSDINGNIRIINEKGNYQMIYTIINISANSEKEAIDKMEKFGYKVESVKFDSFCSEIKIGDNTISLSAKTESELRNKKMVILKEIRENIDNLILSVSGKTPKTKKN